MYRFSSFRWVLLALSAVLLSACVSDIDPDRPVEQEPVQPAAFAPPAKVAIVTSGDADGLWGGVTAIPNTAVSKVSPADYESGNKSQWALVVFDACQPKEVPKVPAFYFNTVPPNSTVKIVRDAKGAPVPVLENSGFKVDAFDRNSPLMKDVFLNDVVIGKAIKLSTGPGWQVVASYSGSPVILANKPASGAAQVIIAFDVDETQWTLHFPHDFPTFMTNAYHWMTEK